MSLFESEQLQKELTFAQPIVIGRQQQHGPPPYELFDQNGEQGLVVADHVDKGIPRRWFRISCDPSGQLTIDNLHRQLSVWVDSGEPIPAGKSQSFQCGVMILLGHNRSLKVVSQVRKSQNPNSSDVQAVPFSGAFGSKGDAKVYRSLAEPAPAPGDKKFGNQTMTLRMFSQPNGEAVVEWLRRALSVVEEAANTSAFFQAAVDAVCDIVALDRAIVLLKDENNGQPITCDSWIPDLWFASAERIADGIQVSNLPRLSQNIIQLVGQQKRTILHDPLHSEISPTQSLQELSCVVASPILDNHRELIGILYGDRWARRGGLDSLRISDLEATLVEVLAGTVAGGIARLVEERRRNTLAEHFSPSVANQLATNPSLMTGHDAEVSVLFCDIRGFSSVTERLGAQKTIEWINDVFSELSQCVVDTDGVLVDYIGDELLAMWGAPVAQPDHAKRAVDTARAMLGSIEILRQRWKDVLPERFGAGIGVNTGPAQVGNVGSRLKFKYGVLGNTVNVGSRIQSATKQLGIDCVISESTARAADCLESARRIANISFVGIEEATNVYQIVVDPANAWRDFTLEYEAALDDYEHAKFGEATRRLGQLMQTHPGDRACKLLLSRAVDRLDEPIDDFSPIWRFTQK